MSRENSNLLFLMLSISSISMIISLVRIHQIQTEHTTKIDFTFEVSTWPEEETCFMQTFILNKFWPSFGQKLPLRPFTDKLPSKH